MYIFDNFKPSFLFHTFDVIRTIDVLDSENQPGSGLQGTFDKKKNKIKKKTLKII